MKNLFIVYPGACGGNHIANLITLNNRFTPRFKSKNYHSDMLKWYKYLYHKPVESGRIESVHGHKAHFTEYEGLKKLFNDKLYAELSTSTTINVFNGHEHEFETAELGGKLISNLPEGFWFIMNYPRENSIPHIRIKLFQMDPRPARYEYPFYSTFDKSPDYAIADETNSLQFDTESFFTETGVDYLNQKLEQAGIDSLPAIAYELHSLWYKKIIELLVLFDRFPK